jgi:Transposase DDE domain
MRRILLLDFDIIDNWHSDLDGKNEGKEGAIAYRYPDSFICSTSWLYESLFHLPYRQAEGVVVRAHANDKIPSVPDYSTIINRCVNKLDIKIDKRIGNDIVIALDCTGIKVANRGGEWIRDKWNVREGYLKIHVVADDIKKKKIVTLDVTSEEVHENGTMLKRLVDNSSENNDVKSIIADGAYDGKENFRYRSVSQSDRSWSQGKEKLQSINRLLPLKKNSNSAAAAKEF